MHTILSQDFDYKIPAEIQLERLAGRAAAASESPSALVIVPAVGSDSVAISAQGHRQRLLDLDLAGCWLLAAGQISDLRGIFE